MASIDNDYQFDDDDDDSGGRKQRGLLEVNRSRLTLLQGEQQKTKDKKTKYKIQNTDCKKMSKIYRPQKSDFGIFRDWMQKWRKEQFSIPI